MFAYVNASINGRGAQLSYSVRPFPRSTIFQKIEFQKKLDDSLSWTRHGSLPRSFGQGAEPSSRPDQGPVGQSRGRGIGDGTAPTGRLIFSRIPTRQPNLEKMRFSRQGPHRRQAGQGAHQRNTSGLGEFPGKLRTAGREPSKAVSMEAIPPAFGQDGPQQG
jgi:hypothetical protein